MPDREELLLQLDEEPRFDVEALREMAGPSTFERGAAYYRGGQVTLLSVETGRVVAQVTGTEDYRTELTGRGKQIGGACTCPAFEDLGFCKHMVATALAANASGTQPETTGVLERIRQHLKARGVDALVDMIMSLAERDAALFRQLDMSATALDGDDKTLETRLRQMLDRATGGTKSIDYYQASEWADGVDEVLDVVADLVSAGRAGPALRLADRAVARVEGALDRIDDFNGHCGALLGRACTIHLAAARLEPPEPVRLARDLFAREMGSGYGTFDGAVVRYADVLGEAGLGEYRRLAAEAWQKLPSRSGMAQQQSGFSGDYHRLCAILDFFAERDGDVDARIALRSKDLSWPGLYLQLAEFCLSQGREDEALRRAEDGLWMFEDSNPDERLLLFTVRLLVKAGRKADAEERLWRAFQKVPSVAVFAELRALGGTVARDRALKQLEAGLERQVARSWFFPADFLVGLLIGEGMLDRAWEMVRKRDASPELKERLATRSEATHAGEALAIYAERINQLAALGGDPSYDKAAQLIARMAKLQDAATQGALIAELRLRYARKRNFIKRLG